MAVARPTAQNIVSMIHIVRICRVFHEAGVLNLIDDQQPGKNIMSAQSANNSVTVSRLSGALKSPRSKKFGKWLLIFVLVFGAFALVEAIGFTLYRRRHPAKQTENFLDVGNQVVFKNTTPDGSWVVRYRGSDWQARPAREETRKDAPLVITKASGNILIVDNPPENAN